MRGAALAQFDLRLNLPDGAVVGYADVGDPAGRPVVFFHGTPASRLQVAGLTDEAARRLGVRLLAPDRPGIGLSSFRSYSVADYPRQVEALADHLSLDRFAVVGWSGGARYVCACAWRLPERVTRAVVVSGTCSSDLPGARAAWSKEDRRAYLLAARAPWLLRLVLAKAARDLRKGNPASLLALFPELSAADRQALERDEIRRTLEAMVIESVRPGTRGAAHDYMLEARPWGIPLQEVEVSLEIWHGEDDRVVSPEQSRLLAAAMPHATTHLLPGEGHSLWFGHVEEILGSAVGS